MTNKIEIRDSLRNWVKLTAKSPVAITDQTPLLESGVISSLQVMDLLLFIEELRGSPLDISELKPGAIGSVDAICRNFFEEKKNVA